MQKHRRTVLLIAASVTLTLGLASCIVEAEPVAPVATVTVGTDYYNPLYHDGYVVYFDEGGRPYYYLNGAVVWIPAGHPFYGRYTGYYHRHRGHYWRWHRARGNRYRNYRRRSTQRHHHKRGQPDRRNRGNRGPSGGRGGGGGGRRR